MLLTEILRWAVLLASIVDSYKYKFLTNKISRLKSSREVSRKFINVSIFHKILLLIYSLIILKDWVITWSCIIAIYTSLEAFYYVYLFYPYKMRGLKNFKRPSILEYTLNSILPNKNRKRL